MYYQLQVKRSKEFLTYLIDSLPIETRISFEGDLSKVTKSDYVISTEELGNLIRNTRTPKQDFWVFKLDESTKGFLKKDFLNRVGIRKNVIHILGERQDKLIFTAHDNFNESSVLLLKSEIHDDDFIRFLKEERVLMK